VTTDVMKVVNPQLQEIWIL